VDMNKLYNTITGVSDVFCGTNS